MGAGSVEWKRPRDADGAILGPVDREDDNMVEATVAGTPIPQDFESNGGPAWAEGVSETWEAAIADGLVPEGTPVPAPDRAAMACDDDVTGATHGAGKNIQWEFERQYTFEDDSFVPSLQGDPSPTTLPRSRAAWMMRLASSRSRRTSSRRPWITPPCMAPRVRCST